MPDQKPNLKNILLPEAWTRTFHDGLNWGRHQVASFTGKWEKVRDITRNNFELGKMHFQLGNLNDAVFRFKIVTWLEPRQTDAWFFLGASYMAQGDMKSARKALARALELQPGYEEARYMMAIAKGKEAALADLPRKMPLALAKSHFDSVAAGYTGEQLEVLNYQGHTLLCAAIRACLVEGRVDHEIVELGVGTGLCGPLLRPVASRLIGVDISGNMLAEAMKQQDEDGKKIYDMLLHKEMHEFLGETPDGVADIVLSAVAFSYVGDLSDIFSHVARILCTGGIFAFTVDSKAGADFQLDTTVGRFRFSEPYLQGLAREHGLTQVQMEQVAAYPDYMMLLCVFSK